MFCLYSELSNIGLLQKYQTQIYSHFGLWCFTAVKYSLTARPFFFLSFTFDIDIDLSISWDGHVNTKKSIEAPRVLQRSCNFKWNRSNEINQSVNIQSQPEGCCDLEHVIISLLLCCAHRRKCVLVWKVDNEWVCFRVAVNDIHESVTLQIIDQKRKMHIVIFLDVACFVRPPFENTKLIMKSAYLRSRNHQKFGLFCLKNASNDLIGYQIDCWQLFIAWLIASDLICLFSVTTVQSM